MCLGLTSRYFHGIFHAIYGGGENYRIKRYPFDLRMQESVCSKHLLFWWWDHWFLEDSDDIVWEKRLGELLREERLWGELKCCEECWRYKPRTAFDGKCRVEMEALERNKDVLETLSTEDIEWLREGCRRCRVRKIFVFLEEREEMFENSRTGKWNEWEMGNSSGLKRLRMTSGDADLAHIEKRAVSDERNDPEGGYESWEFIYAGLGI